MGRCVGVYHGKILPKGLSIISKLETRPTRRYWRGRGGTLIEEFPAVRGPMAASYGIKVVVYPPD
jgi:hypothetical protein